ncbi:hybrid sensor histidine kinase/response regulator [bacterium]|nr:hybrid sensor histidine kinase/response regulator [bacterium]
MSAVADGPLILVVEDDDTQARLTERVLRRHGFRSQRVATGFEALAVLQRGLDAVVLLDLGLPDMPGIEVLEQIVARSEETPVIVVTGIDDLTVAVDAIRRGGWDYVVKRVDLNHLNELPHVIRRNQDRQRLVRERNLFRSMLSHDIRNPLNVIFNYADMIGDEPGLSAGARQLLQRIKDNAASTLNLVCNFVELGRIEGGTLTLDRRPLCLTALVREAIARQEALGAARGVTLTLANDDELAHVPADGAYMERVLTNLIGNALKFSPDGATVTVGLTQENGCVAVSVSDDGPGIAPDELGTIFDKYRRGRATAAVEGSGLGLFIVKSVVDAHGGSIEVRSEPGHGATFILRLPLAAPAPATSPLRAAS